MHKGQIFLFFFYVLFVGRSNGFMTRVYFHLMANQVAMCAFYYY